MERKYIDYFNKDCFVYFIDKISVHIVVALLALFLLNAYVGKKFEDVVLAYKTGDYYISFVY